MTQRCEGMIINCVNSIVQLEECDWRKAFELFLDWLSLKLEIAEPYRSALPMRVGTRAFLDSQFSIEAMRNNYCDWFKLALPVLQIDTPGEALAVPHSSEWEAKMNDTLVNFYTFAKPVTIMDADCGTGTALMGAYLIAKNDAIYYGVTNSLLVYRIALINMKLYGIPAYILFADVRKHDLNLNSSNWRKANLWNPPNSNELEMIPVL